MRGCNYSCTYCIVPYVRGREIYHSMEQILGEVRDRVSEGARELTLLGQTVTSYRHGPYRFGDLLRAVAGVEAVERIRFISPGLLEDRITFTDPKALTKPWDTMKTYRKAKPGNFLTRAAYLEAGGGSRSSSSRSRSKQRLRAA